MPHTADPFTVEELGDSADTERDLGITRIVCAPAQYEAGEKIAVAFVVFPDDAPLFAASKDLLAAAEDAVEVLSDLGVIFASEEVALERLRAAIAKARTVA